MLPSGPKTNDEPTSANDSSLVMPSLAFWKTIWPVSVLRTRQGEDDLQAEAPGDGRDVDRAAVGGHQVGDPEDHHQADQRLRPRHAAVLRQQRGDHGDQHRPADNHQLRPAHAAEHRLLRCGLCHTQSPQRGSAVHDAPRHRRRGRRIGAGLQPRGSAGHDAPASPPARPPVIVGARARSRSTVPNQASSAGRIRASQSASLREPPGKSEPAAPGCCIRPTALLACSLAQASPNARRPRSDAAADGCGMPRETGDCRQAPRRQFANTLAGAGRQRGWSAITHTDQTARPPRPAVDHGRRAGLPRSRPESGERGARTGPSRRRHEGRRHKRPAGRRYRTSSTIRAASPSGGSSAITMARPTSSSAAARSLSRR